jgi:uncharacterized repeat protein (TIGR01451 family)
MKKSMMEWAKWRRSYWLIPVSAFLFALIFMSDSTAWAAQVAAPAYQTVPRPTPTSSAGPVPTATRRSGGDSGGESGGDSGNGAEGGGQQNNTGEGGVGFEFNFNQGPGAGQQGQNGAQRFTAVVNVASLNLREGPGTNYAILGALPLNTEITIQARNEDGSWYYACCFNDTVSGWVSAQLVTPNFDATQATTLIPLFGAAPEATATPVAQPVVTMNPVDLAIQTNPDYAWQGQAIEITIVITNPNQVEIRNVELSDEIPRELTLLDVTTSVDGLVKQNATSSGQPLVLVNWPRVPAGRSVSVTFIVEINEDVPDGTVIDNLVAVRGANVAYTTGGVSIGMPPVVLPNF